MARRFGRLRAATLTLAVATALAGMFCPGRAHAADAPTPRVITGPGAPAGDGVVRRSRAVTWREIEPALAEARRANRIVLVDVYTPWCGWCKRMEKTTYADAEVRDYLAKTFVTARLDAEEDGKSLPYEGRRVTYRQFADRFKISSYPTTLFLASDGSLLTAVPGYAKADRFLTVLHYIGDGHYRTKSWDAYTREDARP